jgi:hypothetical protein
VDVTKSVLECLAGAKKHDRISVYSSFSRLEDDIAQRRTAVILGIGSIRTLINDPGWAKVLAKIGIRYVRLDSPSPFFAEDDFTQEGRKIWSSLEENGIVIMISGLTPGSRMRLLENARKPFVLIEEDLPPTEILELMKKKETVLALVLDENGAAGYYQKLDRAKRVLGSNRVMVMNGRSIRESTSIEFFRHLTREILQAGYEWKDIQNLFSGTFLSLFE